MECVVLYYSGDKITTTIAFDVSFYFNIVRHPTAFKEAQELFSKKEFRLRLRYMTIQSTWYMKRLL